MHFPDWFAGVASAAAVISLVLPAYFLGPMEDLRDWWRRR